jgi:signal peptidase
VKSAVKIINVIITIGTIYVAIIAAIFVLPRAFGLMPYVVLSGSMEPSIPTGSVAFIDQKDRDVEVGDVVTYRVGKEASIETGAGSFASAEEGTLVTHRIVRMAETGNYITKGDANEVEDVVELNPVQIVGTYKFNIPRLGSLMLRLGTRTITMILIALIVLNIVTSLLSWAWEDEEKKEENENNDDSAKEENKDVKEDDSDNKENEESEEKKELDMGKSEESNGNDDSTKDKCDESASHDDSVEKLEKNTNPNPQEKSEEDDLNKEETESENSDTSNSEDNDLNKEETEDDAEENTDIKEKTELEMTEINEIGDKKEEECIEDKTEDLSKIKIEGKEENAEDKTEEDKEENLDGKNHQL